MDWEKEKETIKKLIEAGEPYEAIGRRYGYTGAGIKKAAKRLGLEVRPRRAISESETFNKGKGETIFICEYCGKKIEGKVHKSRKYCSKTCSSKHQSDKKIQAWLSGDHKKDSIIGSSGMIRRYLLRVHDSRCSLCGWGEINKFTGKVPLEVHHIDGDCCNNDVENLQLLCPNCHSLTSNYGSRGGSKNSRKRTEYTRKG